MLVVNIHRLQSSKLNHISRCSNSINLCVCSYRPLLKKTYILSSQSKFLGKGKRFRWIAVKKPVLLLFNNSYFTKRKVYFGFRNVSIITTFVPVFPPSMGKACSVNTSVAQGWAQVCPWEKGTLAHCAHIIAQLWWAPTHAECRNNDLQLSKVPPGEWWLERKTISKILDPFLQGRVVL